MNSSGDMSQPQLHIFSDKRSPSSLNLPPSNSADLKINPITHNYILTALKSHGRDNPSIPLTNQQIILLTIEASIGFNPLSQAASDFAAKHAFQHESASRNGSDHSSTDSNSSSDRDQNNFSNSSSGGFQRLFGRLFSTNNSSNGSHSSSHLSQPSNLTQTENSTPRFFSRFCPPFSSRHQNVAASDIHSPRFTAGMAQNQEDSTPRTDQSPDTPFPSVGQQSFRSLSNWPNFTPHQENNDRLNDIQNLLSSSVGQALLTPAHLIATDSNKAHQELICANNTSTSRYDPLLCSVIGNHPSQRSLSCLPDHYDRRMRLLQAMRQKNNPNLLLLEPWLARLFSGRPSVIPRSDGACPVTPKRIPPRLVRSEKTYQQRVIAAKHRKQLLTQFLTPLCSLLSNNVAKWIIPETSQPIAMYEKATVATKSDRDDLVAWKLLFGENYSQNKEYDQAKINSTHQHHNDLLSFLQSQSNGNASEAHMASHDQYDSSCGADDEEMCFNDRTSTLFSPTDTTRRHSHDMHDSDDQINMGDHIDGIDSRELEQIKDDLYLASSSHKHHQQSQQHAKSQTDNNARVIDVISKHSHQHTHQGAGCGLSDTNSISDKELQRLALAPDDSDEIFCVKMPTLDQIDKVYHTQNVLGCQHYERSCHIAAGCCNRFYPCRYCHDACENHQIVRKEISRVVCIYCILDLYEQEANINIALCHVVPICQDVFSQDDHSLRQIADIISKGTSQCLHICGHSPTSGVQTQPITHEPTTGLFGNQFECNIIQCCLEKCSEVLSSGHALHTAPARNNTPVSAIAALTSQQPTIKTQVSYQPPAIPSPATLLSTSSLLSNLPRASLNHATCVTDVVSPIAGGLSPRDKTITNKSIQGRSKRAHIGTEGYSIPFDSFQSDTSQSYFGVSQQTDKSLGAYYSQLSSYQDRIVATLDFLRAGLQYIAQLPGVTGSTSLHQAIHGVNVTNAIAEESVPAVTTRESTTSMASTASPSQGQRDTTNVDVWSFSDSTAPAPPIPVLPPAGANMTLTAWHGNNAGYSEEYLGLVSKYFIARAQYYMFMCNLVLRPLLGLIDDISAYLTLLLDPGHKKQLGSDFLGVNSPLTMQTSTRSAGVYPCQASGPASPISPSTHAFLGIEYTMLKNLREFVQYLDTTFQQFTISILAKCKFEIPPEIAGIISAPASQVLSPMNGAAQPNSWTAQETVVLSPQNHDQTQMLPTPSKTVFDYAKQVKTQKIAGTTMIMTLTRKKSIVSKQDKPALESTRTVKQQIIAVAPNTIESPTNHKENNNVAVNMSIQKQARSWQVSSQYSSLPCAVVPNLPSHNLSVAFNNYIQAKRENVDNSSFFQSVENLDRLYLLFFQPQLDSGAVEVPRQLSGISLTDIKPIITLPLAQNPNQSCSTCLRVLSRVYCNDCRLFDDKRGKAVTHCALCSICRQGTAEQLCHCQRCNVCFCSKVLRSWYCEGKSGNVYEREKMVAARMGRIYASIGITYEAEIDFEMTRGISREKKLAIFELRDKAILDNIQLWRRDWLPQSVRIKLGIHTEPCHSSELSKLLESDDMQIIADDSDGLESLGDDYHHGDLNEESCGADHQVTCEKQCSFVRADGSFMSSASSSTQIEELKSSEQAEYLARLGTACEEHITLVGQPLSSVANRPTIPPAAVAVAATNVDLSRIRCSRTTGAPMYLPVTLSQDYMQQFINADDGLTYPHMCIKNIMATPCFICFEDLSSSNITISTLSCSHVLHSTCLRNAVSVGISRCPLCRKTISRNDAHDKQLEAYLAANPMPANYKDVMAMIGCNDCSKTRMKVKYHHSANRCPNCTSFNTYVVDVDPVPRDN